MSLDDKNRDQLLGMKGGGNKKNKKHALERFTITWLRNQSILNNIKIKKKEKNKEIFLNKDELINKIINLKKRKNM